MVDLVGLYIRMHERLPYKNPMESVTSHDKSAPLCTSLQFKPWRDVYNGASKDFQEEEDDTNWSTSSVIIETENGSLRALLQEQYIRKMIKDKEDLELYKLESLMAEFNELMTIAAKTKQEIKNREELRDFRRVLLLGKHANRKSVPESSSGQVTMEKNASNCINESLKI